MTPHEDELLRVLNSAPIVNGEPVEQLTDPRMRALREDLRAVIQHGGSPDRLSAYLDGVRSVPRIAGTGVEWTLDGPADALPYAELVLEWSRVERELPGRLRACGNPDCSKFLIDHSRPNSARWCSMAECGNRLKARRHHARQAASGD